MECGVRDGEGGVRPDDLDGLVLLDALGASIEQEGEQAGRLVRAGLRAPQRLDRRAAEVNAQGTDGVHTHGTWSWVGSEMILEGNDRRLGGTDLGGIQRGTSR